MNQKSEVRSQTSDSVKARAVSYDLTLSGYFALSGNAAYTARGSARRWQFAGSGGRMTEDEPRNEG